jgi:peptidoglycan/xylan/chitin deacetylase (PgdA/CDA1 family)
VYFGSVKFFKHLIVIVIALLITTAVALVIVLTIENNELKKEKEDGQETSDTGSETSQNPPADETASAPVTDTQPTPTTAETSNAWPPEADGAYAALFPNLYAEEDNSDINYKDDSNCVYLTFDDGPNNSTNSILDYLDENGVKATFFVVPKEGYGETIKRITDEGHALAVHTYSHVYDEVYASVEAYLEDFNKARELIHEQTGIWADIFRFPGGSVNSYNKEVREDIIGEMTRRGFVYFDWNVDSRDSGGASWEEMMNSVPKDVEEIIKEDNRAVVLFHDAGSFTTWAIDDIIKELKYNGYTFEVIDRNVKPVKW